MSCTKQGVQYILDTFSSEFASFHNMFYFLVLQATLLTLPQGYLVEKTQRLSLAYEHIQ